MVPAPVTVTKTTSETLKHKINPSFHLAEPQTVHVLLFIPGISCYVACVWCVFDYELRLLKPSRGDIVGFILSISYIGKCILPKTKSFVSPRSAD